jgi:hypothetical protein
MSQGKSFFMMFDVITGGIVEPIDLTADALAPNRSIIVMDEENLRVWLWHGKLQGLVPRRTALRQAQSLKGHGYQAGNAIIGRGISDIVEIDSRKIGREPETTKINDKFMALLNTKFSSVGNFIYSRGSGGAVNAPKADPKPKPKQEKMATPSVNTRQVAAVNKKAEEEDKKKLERQEKEAKLKAAESEKKIRDAELKAAEAEKKAKDAELKAAEAEKKAKAAEEKIKKGVSPSKKSGSGDSKELLFGAMIMSIVSEYKDLWISSKEDGVISVEQMDGKICAFAVDNGKIKMQPGSYADVSENKKSAIDKKFSQLSELL